MGRKFHREDRKCDGRTKNTTGWRVLNHQQASGNNGSKTEHDASLRGCWRGRGPRIPKEGKINKEVL